MLKYYIGFVLMALIFLCGCSQSREAVTLQNVERLMDLTPDSAYLVLRQAGYNEESSETRPRMMARYAIGIMAQDSGEYANSMVAFAKALNNARRLDNHKWMGKSAIGMTKIFEDTYHHADGYFYAKVGYNELQKAGIQPDINNALFNLAKSAYHCKDYYSTETYCRQLMDSAKVHRDSALLTKSSKLLGLALLRENKYTQALHLWENIVENFGECADDTVALVICRLALNRIGIDDFLMAWAKAKKSDISPWLGKKLGELLRDSVLIRTCQNAINESESEKFARINKQPFVSGTIDRYSDEWQRNDDVLKQHGYLSLFVIAFIAGSIIIVIRIRRRHQLKIASVVSAHKTDVDIRLRNLLVDTYHDWDIKCREYYSYGKTKAGNELSEEVNEFIHRFGRDSDSIAEAEALIDNYQSNLMSDFKAEFPKLKEVDYRLFLYTVLGFSIPSIALLLGEEKTEAVYNRKGRLKIKIKKAGGMNCNRYLEALK